MWASERDLVDQIMDYIKSYNEEAANTLLVELHWQAVDGVNMHSGLQECNTRYAEA